MHPALVVQSVKNLLSEASPMTLLGLALGVACLWLVVQFIQCVLVGGAIALLGFGVYKVLAPRFRVPICGLCAAVIEQAPYQWRIEGEKKDLCATCNHHLKHKVSRAAVNGKTLNACPIGIPPIEVPVKRTRARNPSNPDASLPAPRRPRRVAKVANPPAD